MVLGAMFFVGCGRAQGEPDPAPSSSTGVGNPNTTPPPTGTNGQCNDLAVMGAAVTDTIAAAAPPLGGGAMVDGTYVLTKYEWYTPNQIHTHVITLQISGGGIYGQYFWQRDTDSPERSTVNIATQGAQIAMHASCGQDLEWDQYGMTDTGLTLYSSRDTKAAFFSRQ
jgi:hypothetical protein